MNTLLLATPIGWPVSAEHDRASARVPLSRFASLTFANMTFVTLSFASPTFPSLTLTSRP